jgi:hypothetical protein
VTRHRNQLARTKQQCLSDQAAQAGLPFVKWAKLTELLDGDKTIIFPRSVVTRWRRCLFDFAK